MPHVPLFASTDFKGHSARGIYGDVVEELDGSVGRILETLRQEGLTDQTLVFFTSDNGPWLRMKEQGGSAGLLREGKGSTWEGGVREPAVAWWPGRIAPGVVSQELAGTMDLFATGLTLAGVPLPQDRVIDGVDMSPILFGAGESRRDAHFYYRGEQLFAVRKGWWKAHFKTRTGYGPDQAVTHEPPALYHLGRDPGEQFDVGKEHPDVIAALEHEAERHRATLEPVENNLDAVIAASSAGGQPSGPTPTPADPDLARGEMLYRVHCASCHGKQGSGDGPVASALRVRPVDLTRLEQRAGGQFPQVDVTAAIDGRTEIAGHGSRDMPVWGLTFVERGRDTPQEREVEAEIRALVRYLVSLQRR
jgi:mono/diheme cytochrome c family protein